VTFSSTRRASRRNGGILSEIMIRSTRLLATSLCALPRNKPCVAARMTEAAPPLRWAINSVLKARLAECPVRSEATELLCHREMTRCAKNRHLRSIAATSVACFKRSQAVAQGPAPPQHRMVTLNQANGERPRSGCPAPIRASRGARNAGRPNCRILIRLLDEPAAAPPPARRRHQRAPPAEHRAAIGNPWCPSCQPQQRQEPLQGLGRAKN
jgi:hypothetical protein